MKKKRICNYFLVIGILTLFILVVDILSFFQISAPFQVFSLKLAIEKFFFPNLFYFALWVVVILLALVKFKQLAFLVTGLSPLLFIRGYQELSTLFIYKSTAFWLVNLYGFLQILLGILGIVGIIFYYQVRASKKT